MSMTYNYDIKLLEKCLRAILHNGNTTAEISARKDSDANDIRVCVNSDQDCSNVNVKASYAFPSYPENIYSQFSPDVAKNITPEQLRKIEETLAENQLRDGFVISTEASFRAQSEELLRRDVINIIEEEISKVAGINTMIFKIIAAAMEDKEGDYNERCLKT